MYSQLRTSSLDASQPQRVQDEPMTATRQSNAQAQGCLPQGRPDPSIFDTVEQDLATPDAASPPVQTADHDSSANGSDVVAASQPRRRRSLVRGRPRGRSANLRPQHSAQKAHSVGSLMAKMTAIPYLGTFAVSGGTFGAFDGARESDLAEAVVASIANYMYGPGKASAVIQASKRTPGRLLALPKGYLRNGRIDAPKGSTKAKTSFLVALTVSKFDLLFGRGAPATGRGGLTKKGQDGVESIALMRLLQRVVLSKRLDRVLEPSTKALLYKKGKVDGKGATTLLWMVQSDAGYAKLQKALGKTAWSAVQGGGTDKALQVFQALLKPPHLTTLLDLLKRATPGAAKVLAEKQSAEEQMAAVCSGMNGRSNQAVTLHAQPLLDVKNDKDLTRLVTQQGSVSRSAHTVEYSDASGKKPGKKLKGTIEVGKGYDGWREEIERTVKFIGKSFVYYKAESGVYYIQETEQFMRDVAVLKDARYHLQRHASSQKGIAEGARAWLKWLLVLWGYAGSYDAEAMDAFLVKRLRHELGKLPQHRKLNAKYSALTKAIATKHPKLVEALVETSDAQVRVGLGAQKTADNVNHFLVQALPKIRSSTKTGTAAEQETKAILEKLWKGLGTDKVVHALVADKAALGALELQLVQVRTVLYGLHCLGLQGMDALSKRFGKKK